MSLVWCKKQGVKLTEPSEALSEEYFKSAEETLMVTNLIRNSGSNMWLATQKYYAEYLAAYSLLMKIGIKSELHSCTIEIIGLLQDSKLIDFDFAKMLEEDKELRIDNQYYLKNRPVDFEPRKLGEILLKIRKASDSLTEDQIVIIRKQIKFS